ncbi:Uncharacterised protein [Vibrio cholerae]|nr:Uncharacterised protein [Vibrio cholerae]
MVIAPPLAEPPAPAPAAAASNAVVGSTPSKIAC